MTLLRRIAHRISASVAAHVPPDRVDWAEGLAREIEFIPSDWRALLWAVGSVRVLAGAPGEAHRPPLWYLWPIAQILFAFDYSISLYEATNWHDRIASALLVFGWGCWSVFTVANLLDEQNQPPISDIRAYRLYTRTKLERRLKRYRTSRRWLYSLVPASLGVGSLMTLQEVGLGYLAKGLIVLFTLLAIVLLNWDSPGNIEVRLARVNQRIAEAEAPQP